MFLLESVSFQNTDNPLMPISPNIYVHTEQTQTDTYTLVRAKKRPHTAWAEEAEWLGRNTNSDTFYLGNLNTLLNYFQISSPLKWEWRQ